MKILDQALEVARNFKPIDKEQLADLLARTQSPAQNGQFELFKTTENFDGTVQNPEWLGLDRA